MSTQEQCPTTVTITPQAQASTPKKPKAKPSGFRGLYKRGDVWYSCIAGVDGQMIRRRLSTDRKTAIAILGELRKNIELQRQGIIPQTMILYIKSMSELWELFLKDARSGRIAKSTIETNKTAYTQVITRNNIKYIRDIHIAVINRWAAKRLATGTRGQTINLYVATIRRALEWGVNNGHIAFNPLKTWKLVRENEPRARRDLTAEDLAELYETTVGTINKTALRNACMFPRRICFRLSTDEWHQLKRMINHENVDRGDWLTAPLVFTDEGALAVAKTLNTFEAIRGSVIVWRVITNLESGKATA